MTAIAQPRKKGIFDAIFFEPLELAIDQPPQLLISAASVFLVAAEAGILIDAPWNIALAIGAEWAYLRGLCSGQAARTRWAAALIWAAVILVIGYGSLWGLRQFGVALPGEGFHAESFWAVVGAVLITALHIGCISAVTLCSAMCHRAELIARRIEEERIATETRERKQAEAEEQRRREQAAADYQLALQRQRDTMQLDLERRWKEEQISQAAARVRAELRASVRAQQAPIAPGTATDTLPNTDREQLRAQIVRTLREQPKANRAQLARDLGIGRTLLYELIAEARQRGDLE